MRNDMIMHHLKKLRSTMSILSTLFMARTFGEYEVSVWDGSISYAKYRWRGQLWAFPTTPINEEEDTINMSVDEEMPFSRPSNQEAMDVLEKTLA